MAFDQRYANILDKCLDSLKVWKEFIKQNLDGEEQSTELNKLQEITKEYCKIDNNFQRSENAIKAIEENLNNEDNVNIEKLYQENLKNQEIDDDHTNSDIWGQIFKRSHSVQVVKPKKSKIDDKDFEEVNDSVMCSNAFTAPIDPISKTVIRQPVKNIKCKHVYDSETIYNYIRQSKNRARCPYIGCKNQQLVAKDLKEDPQLKEQITQFLESQQTEEEDDEDSD